RPGGMVCAPEYGGRHPIADIRFEPPPSELAGVRTVVQGSGYRGSGVPITHRGPTPSRVHVGFVRTPVGERRRSGSFTCSCERPRSACPPTPDQEQAPPTPEGARTPRRGAALPTRVVHTPTGAPTQLGPGTRSRTSPAPRRRR